MMYLSKSAREAIVQKVLSRDNKSSMKEISNIYNIGESTLRRWVRNYRNDTINTMISASPDKTLTLSDRFNHLLATSSLDDKQIGIYCREHGLFSFQLKQWKEGFIMQNKDEKQQIGQSELKSLRIENKQLKQELRRKDNALAETAALLVLQKKTALIWGVTEED